MKYKRSLLIWLIPIIVILVTTALGNLLQQGVQIVQADSTGDLIERIYTDKARYNPGDAVTITVAINNQTGSTWNGDLTLKIDHLNTQVHTDTLSLNVANSVTTTKSFTWTTPSADFQGYQVEVIAGTTDQNGTAVDVSSDWTRYPRYGYISEFPTNESATDSDDKVEDLAENYHINAVQLYDWMWKHEKLFKRTNGAIDSTWTDLFNRTISWQTIQNQIDSLHDHNMAAMAYAMVYAAREGYEQESGVNPQWGIYQDTSNTTQLNVDFGDGNTYLWLFNPANTNWQNYIFNEYQDAIVTADFDGIHVDQMGQRSDPYDYWGNTVNLDNTFSNFLNNSKEHLNAVAVHTTGKAGQDTLTFNIVDGAVDGWAASDVSQNANVDFNYSEIWWLSNTNEDIYNYIRQVRENGDGKALVLAAYMNYNENLGARYEAEDATLYNVGTNTDHPGYTGTGFVDQFGESGDYVEFNISVPEAGKYALVFRYANDTGGEVTRSVYVDGTDESQISFHDQVDWDTWVHDAYYTTELTAGNHTIKLARDAGDSGFINLDSLTLGTFDEDSVRLANAAFAAAGAYHIELGEGDQMLAHEYYPNTSKQMRSGLREAMSDHYSFITAYQNLLFDPDVGYGDGGVQWIDINGVSVSGDGSDNTIWTIFKRNGEYDIIHLINLLNNDNEWRNEANTPTGQSDLAAKYYIGPDVTVSGVYIASPDIDHGKTQSVNYTTGRDSRGDYISFTVPSLEYWDMIYVDRSFSAPSNGRYEAEDAILTSTSTNTNHTGYSGSGFVDGFANQNDAVSFYVYADQEDDYYLRFRYANDTGSTATRDVYVDGEFRGTVSMADLANWDTWGDGVLTTRLSAGIHQIVFLYGSSNNTAINLDYVELKPAYVWNFDTRIDNLPEDYYLTFKVGLPGYVHWGTNNWTGTTDTWFVPNGSSDGDHDYEMTIGPFSGDTEINFTFKWDDNDDGTADRWEGEDWSVGTNAPATSFYQVEGMTGNNYSFAQFDARGSLFDFMVPLGIWSGIKVDGDVNSVGVQVNVNKSVAGVKIGGNYYWLNDSAHWTYSQKYITDTNVIETVATHTSENIKITNIAFIPKNITYPTDTSSNDIPGLLVQRFTLENTGTNSQDVTFLYFHDMNINGSNDNDSVEYKSTENAIFYHDPGDTASGRTRTMDFGVAMTTTATATNTNKVYQITDAGYLGKSITLSGSSSETVDVLIVGATTPSVNQNLYTSNIKEAIDWFNSADVDAIQTTTETYWTDLLDGATTFESPDETYNQIYKRSILAAYLYFDAEKGGMGAGSYNGAYFYNWPRDAVYGAVTMDKVGLHDVAENVYDWLWNIAKRDVVGNDYGNDGKYYRFWYQKYTMDGEPEWWNPQIDETAVIPWGAWYHYQQTGDSAFLTNYDDLVKEAGLVSSENNDHPGLDYDENKQLMFSMNAWEDKWGMFLYTNANVYAGLRDGSAFMTAAGDTTTASMFDTRASNIYTGVTGLYSSTVGYYGHAFDVKRNYSDPAIVNLDVSADISMLGLVTPFQVEPVTKTEVISTLLEVEAALTDFSETKMAYGGVIRYRADQEERYGSDYRDLGDSYYDGGPWMMPTNWMSEYYLEWADATTGKNKIDTAKDYLDYVVGYLGNLGIGAEQIDENKGNDEFSLETAWGNVWESNGKTLDNMMAFIDYVYDAPNDSITVSPKIPTDWSYLGSHIQIKNGDLYIKVTENSSTKTTVNLNNNSTNIVAVTVYVQTDSAPTSVTGTSLSWSYNSTTGRVKLTGTLNASTTSTITINH